MIRGGARKGAGRKRTGPTKILTNFGLDPHVLARLRTLIPRGKRTRFVEDAIRVALEKYAHRDLQNIEKTIPGNNQKRLCRTGNLESPDTGWVWRPKVISSNPLMIPKEEMDRLKALIGRAAQRIEDIRYADREEGDEELIAELRKAATQ